MDNNVLYNQQPGMVPQQRMPQYQGDCVERIVRQDTVETRKMKGNFSFFGGVTLLYAVFYAFCMFKNGSGITFPLFIAASVVYLKVAFNKLGLGLKKGSAFYIVSMMLLAVSTFCTDDWRIIAFNKTGIFLLALCFMINQFCDTKKWSLGKYLWNMMLLWFAGIGEIAQPFIDACNYFKDGKGKKNKNVWYVVLGVVVAIPLVAFVLIMLSTADAVFKQVTVVCISGVSVTNIINVVFRVGLIFFATYWLISFLCKRTLEEEVSDCKKGEPVLAITVNSLLTVIYMLFSGIQIVYLFMGQMELPEGYTYAMYAREGFFQLLAVSVLNLVIVLVSLSYFKESKVLKGVLAVMSLCTFVMIASSAYRMIIYIHYYNLTFLRILVLWALALLFVLFVGVIAGIFRSTFPLFRYSMAVVTVMYIVLSFSHPDYIIAKYNITSAGKKMDYSYLSSLSADAATVIIPYLNDLGYDMEKVNEVGFDEYYGRDFYQYFLDENYGADEFGYYYISKLKNATKDFNIRTYNVSRHLALREMER